MKLVVFVEGDTEAACLPELLRRWLDQHCNPRVGIAIVKFAGWSDYYENIARKVQLHLSSGRREDVLGGIGLLDLYGPTLYPANARDADSRKKWAKAEIERRAGNPLFRQHIAVHETEAWLLSQPAIFPKPVADALAQRVQNPELVNFDQPPAKLLDRLYWDKLGKKYKKVIDGVDLFRKLDINIARSRCPSLLEFLDAAKELARC
jgi:Domain of unknown function (DUF4276)